MSASASAIVVDSAGRLCVWLSPRDFASTVMLGSVTADTVGRWARDGWFAPNDVRRTPGGGRWQIRADAEFANRSAVVS